MQWLTDIRAEAAAPSEFVMGNDESHKSLNKHHPTFCLVLGNEGNGLISRTPNSVNDIGPVTIPIVSSSAGLDSLSVASAGAILLHVLGQR